MNNKNNKKQNKAFKIFKKIFIILLSLGMIAFLIGSAFFFYYASSAPKVTEQSLASESATQIFDNQGNSIYSLNQQEREYAEQSEIPSQLKKAIISIEDRRFYSEKGIDVFRIIGAAISNMFGSSKGLQGGSTITQQLVKLSVFSTKDSDRNIKRKAQEAWISMDVDKNFSKDQILTFYINKVYEGNGVYGMKTAADYYFNKELDELSLDETALIAGIPNAPSYYDPYTNPDAATYRRNEVLNSMYNNKKISKSQLENAKKVDVTDSLIPIEDHESEDSNSNILRNDSYIISVLEQAKAKGYDPYKSNYKIYTNFDKNIQDNLYNLANDNYSFVFPDSQIQIASTVMDPKSGDVLAQIGGRQNDTVFGLNRATQNIRSIGSAAKPLVDYGPAMEYLNWPTYRTVNDGPMKYTGTNISINDWDRKNMGNMTMRSALALSRNLPAVRTFKDVGTDKSSKFLNDLGIDIQADQMMESDSIGINVSTVNLAAAYSAFSNGGTYYEPKYINKIISNDGQDTNIPYDKSSAMKNSTAFMMTSMLKNTMEPQATAPGAFVEGLNSAGKSGLVAYPANAHFNNDDIMDSWFSGYTKGLSVSTWVGYDQPMKNSIPYSQREIPAQFYAALMKKIGFNYDNTDWEMPDTVQKTNRGGVNEYSVIGANWSNGGLPYVNSIVGK